MEQPSEFVNQEESYMVCHLKQSPYGLTQSTRAWFGRFSLVILRFGMNHSAADLSVFYCHDFIDKCMII